MATLTIRDLDDALKQRLRVRAAHRNHSMEEEVRQILDAALRDAPTATSDLAQRVRKRFAGLGDIELSMPGRDPIRTPPSFDDAPTTRRARRDAPKPAHKRATR